MIKSFQIKYTVDGKRGSPEACSARMIHARRVASAPVVVVVANDDRDGRVAHAHAYGRGLSSVVVVIVARDHRDDG